MSVGLYVVCVVLGVGSDTMNDPQAITASVRGSGPIVVYLRTALLGFLELFCH